MAIVDYLAMPRGSKVLDFGCAKGYIVKALRWLGRESYGYDISKYCLENADFEVMQYLSDGFPTQRFDYIIAKDVFEHIVAKDLPFTLQSLKANVLFAIVPLGNGQKYECPLYDKDTTHLVRQPLEWWNNLISSNGWKIRSSVTRIEGIKDKYSYWDAADGFIVGVKQ